MKHRILKLIEHVDQLVIWLKNNPTVPLPPSEKNRLLSVLNKIALRQELKTEEWELLKPAELPTKIIENTIVKTITKQVVQKKRPIIMPALLPRNKNIKLQDNHVQDSTNSTRPDDKRMVTCEFCQARLLFKNINKHRKKNCNGKRKTVVKAQAKKKKNTTLIKNNEATFNPKRERKEEGRLDGSNGFHIIRENGRFGSHSMYDNMGDESTS
jgi:hypothetical protein